MRNAPALHGRDHKPGGADPIPGFGICHETICDWFIFNATAYSPAAATGDPEGGNFPYGVELYAPYGMGLIGGAINMQTEGGGIAIATEGGGIDIDSDGGGQTVETRGGGYTIDTRDPGGDGGYSVETGGAGLLLETEKTSINFSTVIEVNLLATGGKFTVFGSDGNPAFEVRADGTVHIRSGHAIIADL